MEHSYAQQDRMINAMKRGVARGLLVETSLWSRFYFDEGDKLVRYRVEEVSTGL
jgi:hypothetical protein